YGGPTIDLSGVPDEAIIDRGNDTDAYSDQAKLTPDQLSRAIARCETLQEFQRILRCPTLLDGAYRTAWKWTSASRRSKRRCLSAGRRSSTRTKVRSSRAGNSRAR